MRYFVLINPKTNEPISVDESSGGYPWDAGWEGRFERWTEKNTDRMLSYMVIFADHDFRPMELKFIISPVQVELIPQPDKLKIV